MRLAAALAALFVAAGAFAQTTGAPVDVRIADYKFHPPEVKVKAGATVRFTNDEKRVSHSVLWLGGGAPESPRLFPGETYERRFDKPGSYPFTCGPHPEMKGVVVVE